MINFYVNIDTKIAIKYGYDIIKQFIYHFQFIRILHFWKTILFIYKKILSMYIKIVNNYKNTFSNEIKIFLLELCYFLFLNYFITVILLLNRTKMKFI